jgi:surfeit locus 1 family protein
MWKSGNSITVDATRLGASAGRATDNVRPGMYRFLLRPRWVGFHLLVVTGIVVMINLGFWQLRRLDERRDFNAVIEARYDEPPVPLDVLVAPDGSVDEAAEWRPVTASGSYLPDETFFVVNRSQNGRAGRNVVVPLELDDGRILIVNRGFVPLQIDEVPDIPAVDVEILGRVRLSQERRLGQLSDPAEGELVEVQRIDIDRLAAQLPGEVVPVYVDLVTSDPPERDDLPESVAPPYLGEGNHLSYAFQWFIFSACVAAGWVIVVRRSARTQPPRHGPGQA